MLEKALELDPHLAVARAEYAFTHLLLVDSGSSNDSAWLYKAEAELRRALQDDPALGRAHSVLAAVYLYQGRKDLMPAELELARKRKVLKQDAQNLYAIEKLSRTYMYAADHAAARRTLELARSQDRQNFELRLCWALLLALEGKRAQALNELKQILDVIASRRAQRQALVPSR